MAAASRAGGLGARGSPAAAVSPRMWVLSQTQGAACPRLSASPRRV